MAVDYQDIRRELETDGFQMEDKEYTEVVAYARRKAKAFGKDESYMPYLLPDLIREWLTRKAINSFTFAVMEIEKNFKQEVNEHGTNEYKGVAGKYPGWIVEAANG